MNNCIGYYDLAISIISIGVVASVPSFLVPDHAFWQATAILAVSVAVFHSVQLWVIRWRQTYFRERVVGDVRHVLQDVINNRLAVIRFTLSDYEDVIASPEFDNLRESIDEIAAELKTLNAASVDAWQDRYARPTDEHSRHAA